MRLLCSIALAATAIAAQTFSGGPAIDRVIDDAIAQGKLPGAVVIIGHEGKIAYRKAYGRRAVVPEPEAMTDDTIFDLASITKVVATTTALMQLFEQVSSGSMTRSPITSRSFKAARAASRYVTCSRIFPVSSRTCRWPTMERLPNRHQASLHGSARRAARRALRL